MLPARGDVSSATPALALVVPAVVAGVLGGRRPAILTALGAAAAFNLAFTRPYWTFKVSALEDVIALVVFLIVAVTVGTLISREADRRQLAEQHAAELERMAAESDARRAERERLALLETLDAQRAALLRSVSHDLRTPLSHHPRGDVRPAVRRHARRGDASRAARPGR